MDFYCSPPISYKFLKCVFWAQNTNNRIFFVYSLNIKCSPKSPSPRSKEVQVQKRSNWWVPFLYFSYLRAFLYFVKTKLYPHLIPENLRIIVADGRISSVTMIRWRIMIGNISFPIAMRRSATKIMKSPGM